MILEIKIYHEELDGICVNCWWSLRVLARVRARRFANKKLHKTLYCVSAFRLDNGERGGLVEIIIDLENHIGVTKND